MMKTRTTALPVGAAVLLVIAVLATFWPCLGNEFTTWDDDVYVTANPLIADRSPAGLRAIFTAVPLGNYHPLTLLSFAAEHRLFGLSPRGFHATNFALHAAVALLALRLLTLLTGSLPAALAGALFFALHPMRVESVAWVADRKDLLAAFFSLGSLLAFLRFRDTGRRRDQALSGALFAAALLSKSTAVALVPVYLLLDHARGRRLDGGSFAGAAPHLALAAAVSLVAFRARASYQDVLLETHVAWGAKAALGAYRFVWYWLARQVFPDGVALLNPFYTRADGVLPSVEILPGAAWLAGTVLALGLLAAALVLLRRNRTLLLGALFFAAGLLPALAAVNIGYRADRFAYLPSVGIAFLVAAAVRWVLGSPRLAGPARAALLAAAGCVLLGFAWLARAQCEVWRDDTTLWADAVRTYPRVATFHSNLGIAWAERGDPARARAHYDAALALDPDDAKAALNRGNLAVERWDFAAALRDYDRAVAAAPRMALAYNNRAVALWRMGRRAEAIADLERALRIDPGFAEAARNLADFSARR